MKLLTKDSSILLNISIHSYPGSTTEEKITIVDNYAERKLKTIIVQDGTNSLLKSRNACVDDLMQDWLDLIKTDDEKFNPNKIVLMTIPPLRIIQEINIKTAESMNSMQNFGNSWRQSIKLSMFKK